MASGRHREYLGVLSICAETKHSLKKLFSHQDDKRICWVITDDRRKVKSILLLLCFYFSIEENYFQIDKVIITKIRRKLKP